MRRLISSAAIFLLLAAVPLSAQEAEQSPEQVYVAYYQVRYADLYDWIADFNQHSVPVLRELQDEGVITGWGAWQHQTGVEYNWRMAIRAAGWAQFDEFWSEYLGRMQARAPEAVARGSEMIQAHFDEVWDLSEVQVPDGLSATYMYDSRYQISFADMAEWNVMWSELVAPVLNAAVEEGLLGGWVRQGHNTGGRYNWKVLYLFEEWDLMDDLFARVTSELTADSEVWEQFTGLIQAHDDVIWTAVPAPEGM
jgi:hypothetical protein